MMVAMDVADAEPAATPRARFEDFYRDQHEPMLRLAYLLTHSRDAAEDVVQDCFVRLEPRWETVAAPAAYLRRSVTNASVSYHRRRGREQRLAAPPPAVEELEPDEMWDALA